MEEILHRFQDLWEQAREIWAAGGWAMSAIAVIALTIFGLGVHVSLRLRSKGFRAVSEETWRGWIRRPSERRGAIGDILDFLDGAATVKEVADRFKKLRVSQVQPFARDLRVMKIFVSAAPLVGLLGTVTGMLATFEALSSGSGGEKTIAMVASGISEALITTETGLVIALPGLFFQYQLARKFERYKSFLAHMESVIAQSVERGRRARMRESDGRRTIAVIVAHAVAETGVDHG